MSTINLKTMMRTAVAASMLLAMGMAAAATTTVNLTAQRMTATGLPPDSAMPGGATVPMWGYCITGSCSATWAVGPTITVPYGNTLTINLTNSLPVPTSIVVLGQLGGGLGSPTRMDSPIHAPQTQTTWPANADATFTPPAQLQRAKSFATEVPANSTSAVTLTWNNLKPGTYLYETGTLPSVQAPMGLYGVLIVTQAPIAAGPSNVPPFAPGNAYPNKGSVATYDSDVALLFSEIDPVQNAAVDNAAVAGTDVKLRFNDVNCNTLPNDTTPRCYPAAVNYTPKYFLINGKSFDQTNPANSAFAVAGNLLAPGTSSTGNVLVRLLNSGSRTHIPSIVGLPMTIVAEDGNVAPGNFKVQNEVLLTAGKTHDVLVKPAAASGAYVGKAFAVFDRQLSLSAANQLNAGMLGYLQVAGGALPSLPTPSIVTPTAVADMFPVPLGTTINGNVRTNDIAVANAAVVASNDPLKGTLTFYSDGTFVYKPLTTVPTTDTFTYNGNDGTTNTVAVTLNIGTATTGTGAPTAHDQTYTSNIAAKFSLSRPGVLANDTSPGNLALTAALADKGTCTSVSVNASGSFTATGSGSCHFTYKAVNSQNLASAAATVTVNFPAGSGLNVTVTDPADGSSITDYRWIIQEDLTFKVVPTGTPSLSTRTLGTSFHKSHMTVVATGCTGPQSCGDDQNVRGSPVTPQARTSPGDVALDSSKNYYISILPGDAGDGGHAMGGTEIRHGWTSAPSVMVSSNAYPFIPAQLSIFIYEDNAPVNGQNDLDENGLGGFNIILMDAVGRSGDPAGQQTYDAMGMPLSNWLLGQPGCPDDLNKRTNGQLLTTTATVRNRNGVIGQINTIAVPSGTSGFSSSPTVTITDPTGTGAIAVANVNSSGRITSFTIINRGSGYTAPVVTVAQAGLSTTGAVGVIYTCPNDPNEGTAQADPAKYALAGHALIKNVTPARYDVIAHPAAARMAAGEVWWQVETLEGTPAQDAFAGVKEPRYFQEFGPPGFHTTIGFVNPKRVAAYATANGLTGNNTITGKITNQHMSRPSNVTLWDSGSYDLLSSTTCLVALNSQGGDGPAIATTQCDPDGNFTLSKVPAGSYEIAVFDQWLDQIIQAVAVSVPEGGNQTVAMGNIPVLSWFTQYDQNIFMESKTKSASLRGVYRQDLGDTGISNVTQSTRYRDGGMSNQTATDSNGNGLLAELFPLFNWYVTEADTTRFKQTGANIIVDAGGPTDTSGDGIGLWNSVYQATPAHPTGCDPTGGSLPSLGGACDSTNTTNRVEIPGAYSYGLQGFISQRNVINWGRTPYAPNENGGIQGLVVNSTTRPFDDQRYNVQTIWEPAVPRVTVNLYSNKIDFRLAPSQDVSENIVKPIKTIR